MTTVSNEDKVKILAAMVEISTSMTRVEAERDLQKNVRDDICKELDLNKKVFTKLSNTYHRQNISEEIANHQEFEELYEAVTK
jgi:Transcriptional regulator DsbA